MKRIIYLFLFLATSTIVQGKASLRIDYLIDEDRVIPSDSVIYGSLKNEMKTLEGSTANLGFLDASVWFKVYFDREEVKGKKIWLELQNPNLDLILIYEIQQGHVLHFHQPSGDQFPFSHRDYQHRYFKYQLHNSADKLDYILVNIDNIGDQFYVPFELDDETEMESLDYRVEYANGIYFGILVFVFLLNLFMYFSLRERANFYYLLYILGIFILQLSLEGYAFEYIYPENTFLANHANPMFASFAVFALVQFCRSFLNLRENIQVFDRIFKWVGYFLFINIILSGIESQQFYQFSILSVNAATLLLNVFIIPLGIRLWWKGYKPARFFVIAFVVLVLAVFLFVLRNFGLVPNAWWTAKSLQIGSALEVILLSLAIVDKFKIFKDQAYDRLQEITEMKSKANIVLEQKVNERTKQLKEQKDLVERKNEEITESIVYAKRIQTGLLPSNTLFDNLFPDSYVLYLPKDIVSGDFYWVDQKDDLTYFAAVDCTGHGVPGAMVSVMGFNHLNRCLNEHGLREPGDILNKLTSLIVESFNKSELTIYDGMDLALCALDRKKKVLKFAGANNPVYLIRNGELTEVKGTKQAIGYHENISPFEQHEIQVEKDDWIVVFSDGFADQFGGPKNKKFKYKAFKEILTEESSNGAQKIKERLTKALTEWKGDVEQVDDICVMGIRV